MTVCSICGRESEGGCSYPDAAGNGRFACWNKECQKVCDAEMRAKEAADIERLRKNGLCIFNEAWIGFCGEEGNWHYTPDFKERIHDLPPVKAIPGSVFCEYHSKQTCGNPGCTNPAVGNCDATSQLVCGVPYCAKCGRHFRCYPEKS